MKKILCFLSLMIGLMNCYSLSAEELYVNGNKLSVYRMSIYDEAGNRINHSDLKAMSVYGFDFDTWNHLRTKAIIAECAGFSGVAMGAIGNIIGEDNVDLAVSLKLGGMLTCIVSILVLESNGKKYESWLGKMRKGPQLCLSPHGVGIAYSF